jgi:hypothetical protein
MLFNTFLTKISLSNFGFMCQLRIRDSTQSTSEHVSQKKVKIAEHIKVELVPIVQFWQERTLYLTTVLVKNFIKDVRYEL